MVFDWFRRKALREGVTAETPVASPATEQGVLRSADNGSSIDLARQRFIVFRQLFPPPGNPGLSFYGGAPVGPAGMPWPRGDADGRPLTFVMQWDAAALAAEAATGLLPANGVLYFFSNLGWGKAMRFRFIHVGGDATDWAVLPEPDDLPPLYGDGDGSQSPLTSPHVPAERRHGLRLLPRWPFRPVGIDYTKAMEADDGNGEGRRFWADGPALSEALLRAQDELATPQPDRAARSPVFERPFAAFPHDWAAVRAVAAAALKQLEYVSAAKWQRFMPDADTAAREAQVAAWRQEALALYHAAAAYPASAAVAPDRADAIWAQIEKFEPIFWPHIDHLVNEAVNLSLGLGSEAVAAIPAALIEDCARRHSLATLTIRDENLGDFKRNRGLKLPWQEEDALFMQAKAAGDLKRVRDIWAPPPNRMFGPPRYVQGDVEEMVDDWLLLLELGSSDGIGLPMGDGVLQFMIRPEDLRARRFDQVIAISTGY